MKRTSLVAVDILPQAASSCDRDSLEEPWDAVVRPAAVDEVPAAEHSLVVPILG